MQKVSLIFQIFFKLFLIFLIVFVWVRFFVKFFVSSIIISAAITAIIDTVTRLFFKRKEHKLSRRVKEKEDAENMFLSLCTSNSPLAFFSKLFKEESIVRREYILCKKDEEKVVLFPYISFNPLTINDIATIMKKIKKDKPVKVIIPTGEISKECHNFINIYDETVVLLDKYQTYNKLYKELNIFPEITKAFKKNKKLSFKELLSFSFNPSRSRGYLLSAVALLFCSLFVRTTLYYSIITSVLLLFAIISHANPFHTKKAPAKVI